MRSCRLPLDLDLAFGITGETQAAVHFPAGGEPGFLLQGFIKLHRVTKQLRDIGIGAQLPPSPAA